MHPTIQQLNIMAYFRRTFAMSAPLVKPQSHYPGSAAGLATDLWPQRRTILLSSLQMNLHQFELKGGHTFTNFMANCNDSMN